MQASGRNYRISVILVVWLAVAAAKHVLHDGVFSAMHVNVIDSPLPVEFEAHVVRVAVTAGVIYWLFAVLAIFHAITSRCT